MSVHATSAAAQVQHCANDPHKLISLLMAGTLERIGQARQSIYDNKRDDFDILLVKIVSIIKGLRASLDFNHGGEIALNLDGLYEYMLARLTDGTQCPEDDVLALNELESLMTQVKEGWDAMPAGRAA
ncbi:flagellar export chaperone FliS [Agaribacterium haliotis]|uniref:flagellar export chaperone FliS n=1 Tax=Agaribacterium haliotis TaxID=2013869 RepID=UPI000BB52DB6|nr:flagellar export chaperone FliS [Agaribacterium haliotis]